jgi:hypothetical protein
MGSFNKDFENMTVGQLRKLTEDYAKCQEIIEKQRSTIEKLKIKYPNAKIEEDFDLNKIIEQA